MTPDHMPGETHNVWRCPHADCRAVQQRERTPTPLDDRRQRAREAGYDACAVSMPTESETVAIEATIETATRVRLDGEIYGAALAAYDRAGDPHSRALREAIEAAFVAAGMEVEQ